MKYSPEELQSFLSLFVDSEFPKGKSADRGHAILHVAMFLAWLKKNVTDKKK